MIKVLNKTVTIQASVKSNSATGCETTSALKLRTCAPGVPAIPCGPGGPTSPFGPTTPGSPLAPG